MTAALLALILVAPQSQSQTPQSAPPPARVQVHVGGDPQLRMHAADIILGALQSARNVLIAERDAEYILSVVVLPVASGGFAISAAVMTVHTDDSLAALARLWGLPDVTANRLRTMFRGSGALVDQRVLTGTDLEGLCGDVVAAFAADTLARTR